MSFKDFTGYGNAMSFWPTREIGYRGGAVFGYLAYRLGLTPNMVSVLGFLVGIAGVLGAFYLPRVWGGMFIAVFLSAAYMLDCADGVLARATGRSSEFGCILDKVLDAGSGILLPVILAWALLVGEDRGAEATYWLPLTALMLVSVRMMASVLSWLKDERLNASARTLEPDQRQKTLGWWIRRSVGAASDEVIFRLALGVAWAFGILTFAFGAMALGYAVLLAGALFVARRDLATI